MNKLIAFFLLLTMVYGCATFEEQLQKEGATPLTQEELESLYAGSPTVKFKSSRASGTVKYHPDGRCEVNWGHGSDHGTWEIKDSMICTQWTIIRDGKKGCFKIYQVGDIKYAIDSKGNLNSTSYR